MSEARKNVLKEIIELTKHMKREKVRAKSPKPKPPAPKVDPDGDADTEETGDTLADLIAKLGK